MTLKSKGPKAEPCDYHTSQ